MWFGKKMKEKAEKKTKTKTMQVQESRRCSLLWLAWLSHWSWNAGALANQIFSSGALSSTIVGRKTWRQSQLAIWLTMNRLSRDHSPLCRETFLTVRCCHLLKQFSFLIYPPLPLKRGGLPCRSKKTLFPDFLSFFL